MSDRPRAWLAMTMAAALWAAGAAARPATNIDASTNTDDLLHFMDGSALHGRLEGIDPSRGLRWRHPAALGPMDLRPEGLDAAILAHAVALKLTPTCHLRLANGDDLFGSLSSLDTSGVAFTAWFGQRIALERSAVRSVTFLPGDYSIVYEGPFGDDGWSNPGGPGRQGWGGSPAGQWNMINRNGAEGEAGWFYRDGAFFGNGPGLLGRDLGLSNSCTVEFDVAWTGDLNLLVDLYSDAADRVYFSSGSYLMQFQQDTVSLQHLRFAGGTPLRMTRQLEPATMPALTDPRRFHVTIQCNKAENAIDLLIDDQLVKEWKDDEGFNSPGGGIVFANEARVADATIKLGGMRISSWSGRREPECAALATNVDFLRFINHDKAGGRIESIHDGKVTASLGGGEMEIPIARVSQIDFAAATNAPPAPASPWLVRAYFPGGGALSFNLEKWDGETVEGESAVFGPVKFRPDCVRELKFNIDKSRADAGAAEADDFEGADE